MIKHRHFIVHKPYGYLSQFVYNEGTMSIGRLDETSEGLLFLTTDGKVSEAVRSKKVEKEYYIQVDGIVTDDAIREIQEGVEIGVKHEKYTTLPCKAARLDPAPNFQPRSRKIRDERHGPTSWMTVTVTEGKFRQVRKMSAAVGFPTLRLVRVRIGEVRLNDLPSGEVMEVDSFFK